MLSWLVFILLLGFSASKYASDKAYNKGIVVGVDLGRIRYEGTAVPLQNGTIYKAVPMLVSLDAEGNETKFAGTPGKNPIQIGKYYILDKEDLRDTEALPKYDIWADKNHLLPGQ